MCPIFFARFLLVFTHRPSVFSLPVPLPRPNPVGMSPWSSKIVSKTKQLELPYPAGKREIPKLNRSLEVSRGSTHGEANDKCIILKIFPRFLRYNQGGNYEAHCFLSYFDNSLVMSASLSLNPFFFNLDFGVLAKSCFPSKVVA